MASLSWRAEELGKLPAWQAAERIRGGSLTASDYLEAVLRRIDLREPTVQAWASRDDVAARKRAAALTAAPGAGALRGLPVGVKDIIATTSLPTTHGSPIYAGELPTADAWCVARVLGEDGLILGKTVTTEFAYLHPGPTTNPWRSRHTPGGSSSGSAAAVADGMVPLAFGTQTAGSIIRPASFCGVFGYKPTFGSYSRDGIKELAGSCDTLGFFARNAGDLAWFDAILRGVAAVSAPGWAPRGWLEQGFADAPRVAVVHGPDWDAAEGPTREALVGVAQRLAAAGATVADRQTDALFAALGPGQVTIMQYEASRALAAEASKDGLSDELRELLAAGAAVSADRYQAALAAAATARASQDALFGDADIILAPSAPGAAPAGLGATGDPVFNRRWTLLHLPCVNVPAHVDRAGLPVGVQLIARRGADELLLAATAWVEAVLQLHWRPPDTG
jgi:Asp-tRNA(Asn)/Glu-tRNA(Gln) amidotransferase A subunit family amidase